MVPAQYPGHKVDNGDFLIPYVDICLYACFLLAFLDCLSCLSVCLFVCLCNFVVWLVGWLFLCLHQEFSSPGGRPLPPRGSGGPGPLPSRAPGVVFRLVVCLTDCLIVIQITKGPVFNVKSCTTGYIRLPFSISKWAIATRSQSLAQNIFFIGARPLFIEYISV